MSDAKEFGMLQSDVKNSKSDIEKLFASNTKRKDENVENTLQLTGIQHTVEESNTSIKVVAAFMEKLSEDIQEIKSDVSNMGTRIGALEDRLFNSAKWWHGVSVLSKNKWFWVFLMFCVFMFTVVKYPEIRPYTAELFGTMKAAKQ